jgi:hypothetical protein
MYRWLGKKLVLVITAELLVVVFLCVVISAYDIPSEHSAPVLLSAANENGSGSICINKNFLCGDLHCELKMTAENISVDNGKLALFSSYMKRQINIDNLELTLNSASVKAGGGPDNSLTERLSGSDIRINNSSAAICGIFELGIDKSNVFSVFADNFDCRLQKDGEDVVEAISRRASIAGRDMKIMLEGSVEINYKKENKILRANKVEWDLQENTFTALGPAMLTAGKEVRTGRYLTMCCKERF